MAAYRQEYAIKSSNIDQVGSTSDNSSSQLPGGACNFRELGRGTKSPVCGCKRFWLNGTRVETSNRDDAWCFCGHHACYHNAASQHTQRLSTQSAIITTQNQASPHRTPEGYVSVQQAGALAMPTGLGIQSQPQSINTRLWDALNGFARQQEGGVYSGGTSQLPSTAIPSVNGDMQEQTRVMGPPVNIPTTTITRSGVDDYQGSATEIATPSIAGTPDLQAFLPPGTQAKRQTLSVQDSGHVTQSPKPAAFSTHEIMNLIRGHASRLDALETLSFSHVPVEEVQEKFEIFDGRMLDLEQWRAETDECLQAEQSRPSRKRRMLPAETSSFVSDESFDSAAAAHTDAALLATIVTNAEVQPRLEKLENRIVNLERTALPSFNNPWQVQVVLLPWGRNLRGIWYSADDATQSSIHTSMVDVDEWSGAQSQVKTSFRSASSDAWTTESIQAWAENARDWLSPKACGPAGLIAQRLVSRGLSRTVTFTATDSRHITDVLRTAFKHILPESKTCNEDKKYQGLHSTFLPLRKIRKSTRLRFLSHAEMITSATWTAGFLESSVFMKIGEGQRRLYITTPEAYLQRDDGLTWQQLRKLPVRDANGDEHAGQIDSSIAIEACWSYNDKLDRIPSLQSSFASHVSQTAWSTQSQQSVSEQGEVGGQLTPAVSGPETHKRTTSLPSSTSAQEQIRETLAKRRVASFESSKATPLLISTSIESTKRRRLSNSPEAERRGVNFTPRYSREPPSPYHSENAVELREEIAGSRKRGTTPFAYATPHSNNFTNPIDVIGDGDTERDSEVDRSDAGNDEEEEEEEWNGMDAAGSTPADDKSFIQPYDDDEYMDEEESNMP